QVLERFVDFVARIKQLGDVPAVIVCHAGANDARRFLGLDRTHVGAAETKANLAALRALAKTLPLAPPWVWATPTHVREDRVPIAFPGVRILNEDVDAIVDAVRALAAGSGDALMDLAKEDSSFWVEDDGRHMQNWAQPMIVMAALDAITAVFAGA